MGSAVVKPLARRRGKIKQNKVDIDPANDNEEENAAGSRESTTTMNCKLNALADSQKKIRQPFFGKPRKDDDDKTQSNRTVCCTYVLFSGKGKAYDSDEELSHVQLVRKKNVSPSQTKNNKQNGTNLSQNVQNLQNPCLAAKCADVISQSQFMQGDNGECLLQSQVRQPLGCANATPVCSKVSDIIHGEARSMQMCSRNAGDQSQKELAVQEDTLLIHKDEPVDRISLQDQHACCEDCVQPPEYDYLEEVKVINTNFSVREPHAASPPLQSCGQSSETKVTTTANNVGVSCSKTKHSPELTCQQRLDVGDQVFIKLSPSVEYTKSQCRGAGESLSAHLNYSPSICLISSDVQKRCFQTLCQDFDLKKLKDSSSDYRCFPLCTNSPRVEGNKSVNATNVTGKSETDETLECNENNAIHFSDSFGDVIKRPLLPDFANSSSTSLSYKGTVMKCDKRSDSSSLNHPHVEDVLAVGEEFLDEIEEVFQQQNSSQFHSMEKGKCITPVKENDDRLQTPSKRGTRASPRSSCSSKHSETNHEWRGSRPGSSAKPSNRSSASVLAHGSTSKAIIEPPQTNNEVQADIFIQATPHHRLSNTRQALMNSEIEYGPGYIDDMLFKSGSIPCASRESLHSSRAALMQSFISGDTLPKEGNAKPLLCFSKESLNSTKEAKSQSFTDNDIMLIDRKVPSVACSINSVRHHESAVPTLSTSNKDVMPADSKVPSKACSSNESLSDQISALMQSVEDIEIINRGSRATSRTCSCKDSVHSSKAVLSRHFSNNENMLKDSRAPSRPCSSKSSLKSTRLVMIPSTLNTSEIPKGCKSVSKVCSCNESLHTQRPVISESISSNEIIPQNKGVSSTTCSSKASLHSTQLVTNQPITISGEISNDHRLPSKQCSSNESVRSSEATQTNFLQDKMRKESIHPPRECSSQDPVQSISAIQAQYMFTCNETQNFTSKQQSPPSASTDITIVQIASKNLSSRPPSSKRSSSSSEHIQGRPRPESTKQLLALSELGQLTTRPHSRQSRHSLNASRPASSLGRRVQPELGDSAQGNELLYGTSETSSNQKGSDSIHGAASFYDGNHLLNVGSFESGVKALHLSPAPMADIAKPQVTNQPPSNSSGSRCVQNSDLPVEASEDTSSFAHFCLSNTFTTLNQTLKSCSRSSMSSRTGTNDQPGEISHENLATPKETISPCSSSLCPCADSLISELTRKHLAVEVESRLAIDANSSAALASAQSYCLSPEKIGNIRRQLYEEGFKPAEREGGVAFFIPVTEDGMQPQTDGAVVAERLTKTKKASLNYEERMFLANINRQVQLSKKKEFAVRDIRNVKGATSSSDGSDRTKQNDDVDDFDISF